MSTRDTGADAPQDHMDVRGLYQANRGRVDVEGFVSALDGRLAGAEKRARRGPAMRRIVIALAVVVVAAGMGIGVWQAAVHLGGTNEPILVIDDPVEPPLTGAGGSVPPGMESYLPPYSSQQPRSVSELRFAEIWGEAAAALNANPRTARLESVQVVWDADGLLESFFLGASTPDGRAIDMRSYLGGPEIDENSDHATFTASAQSAPSAGYLGPLWSTDLFTVSVDRVLGRLDEAGLLDIAAQSGMEVAGDPFALWRAYMESLGPEYRDIADWLGSAQGPDTVLWHLSCSCPRAPVSSQEEAAEQYCLVGPESVSVSLAGERPERLTDSETPPNVFPAVGLELGRQWEVELTAGSGSVFISGPEALVLVPASHVQLAAGTDAIQPEVVDRRLDGLAFALADGAVCRIQDGTAETLSKPEATYDMLGSGCSYGVAYSAGDGLLLYGAGITLVTREGSDEPSEVFGGRQSGASRGGFTDASGGSWSSMSDGGAVLMAIPVTDAQEPRELLRHFDLPMLNQVHYDERTDRVWLTMMSQDPQAITLLTAQPRHAELVPVTPAFTNEFGGDFAVSPDGSAIVYIGTWQRPAAVSLWTPDGQTDLALGLATAYNPVFSPDGGTVCLVGSREGDDDTALWVFDPDGGECSEITATRGLTPTFPAFSPDGGRIAFRNWMLGDVWTVTVDGGELTRYDLPVAEAPIAW